MENNNSKKVLFSIIGVAILIVAVVGVSFAFFTYQRTGTTNNIITSGKITFNFGDNEDNPTGKMGPDGKPIPGTKLELTNQDPKTDEEGEETEEEDKFGFGVDATLPENTAAINFKIYVVPGDAPSGNKPKAAISPTGDVDEDDKTYDKDSDQLDYKYISIMVEGNSTISQESGLENTIVERYRKPGTPEAIQAGTTFRLETDPALSDGCLIAQGTLEDDGTEHIFAYKLSMWINDTLKVSDTDSAAAYRASRTTTGILPSGQGSDDREVYSDKYYSLKIKIVAGDQVGIGG